MSVRAWFYGLAFSAILWTIILPAIIWEPKILAGVCLAVGSYIVVMCRP